MSEKKDYHEEVALSTLRTGIRQLVTAKGLSATIVQLEAHINGLRVLRMREHAHEQQERTSEE